MKRFVSLSVLLKPYIIKLLEVFSIRGNLYKCTMFLNAFMAFKINFLLLIKIVSHLFLTLQRFVVFEKLFGTKSFNFDCKYLLSFVSRNFIIFKTNKQTNEPRSLKIPYWKISV